MADTDDALKHFMSSPTDDPYDLLGIKSTATDKEIRSAWKKTALIYHPDKIRAKNDIDEAEANRIYILRQDAYGVLSEPHLREQYDNALRAKEQKRERDAAFEGRRRQMKEDLERRESGAVKRKMEGDAEEEKMERELARLREDGRRRRRERAEMLRREAEEEERKAEEGFNGGGGGETEGQKAGQDTVGEMDRSVRVRFPQNESTANLDRERLMKLFSRFGTVQEAILRDKKMKVEAKRHRQAFTSAVLIFESIVGAHAAVTDFAKVAESEKDDWKLIAEAPFWASGSEPECIPKAPPSRQASATPVGTPNGRAPTPKATAPDMDRLRNAASASAPSTPPGKPKGAVEGLRKVPSFGSFNKATPNKAATASPGLDEITMIRLKNAERRRMEEKVRKDEEAAAAGGGGTEAG